MKQTLIPLALLASLGLALVVAGCKREEPAQAPAPSAQPPEGGGEEQVTESARGEAKEIFASRCAPCHGPEGKGDGPASASLSPQPRDFSDPEWQASVTDEHIERIIQYGGAAVGRSPSMPPNPDLTGKPVVKALREHIRNLGQQ